MSGPATEGYPEDGPCLEIWSDVREVGEPIQVLFQPEETDQIVVSGDEMLAEYLEAIDDAGGIEVLCNVSVIEGREWVLGARDTGAVGDVSYWVKFMD